MRLCGLDGARIHDLPNCRNRRAITLDAGPRLLYKARNPMTGKGCGMNNAFDPLNILLLAVAVVVFWRLRVRFGRVAEVC